MSPEESALGSLVTSLISAWQRGDNRHRVQVVILIAHNPRSTTVPTWALIED
jgi:hypothetical protein